MGASYQLREIGRNTMLSVIRFTKAL